MAMNPFGDPQSAFTGAGGMIGDPMVGGVQALRRRNPFEPSGRPGQTPEAGAQGGMPTFTPHPDVARMAEAARNGARVQAPYGGGIGGQPAVPPADWQRTMAPGAAPPSGMAPGAAPTGSMAPPPGSFAGGPQIPPQVLQNIMQMLQQPSNQGSGGQNPIASIMQMLTKLAPFNQQGQGSGTMMRVPPAPMQTWNPGGTQMPAPPVPMQTWTPSPGGSGSTAPFPGGIGW